MTILMYNDTKVFSPYTFMIKISIIANKYYSICPIILDTVDLITHTNV